MISFVPEQEEAIRADSETLVIRAGAGAGKTHVLVSRYLRYVCEESGTPEEILAITFTRKAAAEMRLRIAEELRKRDLEREARLALSGPITTVHAYCERLLREYPFEAGIDPDFDVLSEDSAPDLFRRASERAIHELTAEDEFVRAAVEQYGDRNPLSGDDLAGKIARIVTEFRTAGRTPERLEELTESPAAVERSWEYRIRDLLTELLGEPPPDGWQLDLDAVLSLLASKKIRKPAWVSKALPLGTDPTMTAVAVGLARLGLLAWRIGLAEMRAGNFLDFSELELRACELLETHPHLLEGKYRWLLVDEAQDLNPLQYRLIRATPTRSLVLVGDPQQAIYGFRGARRELFIRQFDAALCKTLYTNWRNPRPVLHVVESIFKSIWNDEFVQMRHPHAREVDPFGEEVSNESDPGAERSEPVEMWHLDDRSVGIQIATGVHELIAEGIPPRDITILLRSHADVEPIAMGLASLSIPYSESATGRHYFSRQEVLDVGSVLKALWDPKSDLHLLATLRSPIVGVSADGAFALALHAKSGGISAYEALGTDELTFDKSDLRALDAFSSWFHRLSRRIEWLPAWQILSELAEATSLDARLATLPHGDQLIANVRQMFLYACDRPEMNGLEFAVWLENKRRLRTQKGDAAVLSDSADAVRITTIHQAKGLEWPVVVLYAKSSTGSRWVDLLIDGDGGVVVPCTQSTKVSCYHAVAAQREEHERAEDRRLLYVGMTRAKRRLCIAQPPSAKAKRNSWVDLVNRIRPRSGPTPMIRVRRFDREPTERDGSTVSMHTTK